MALCQSTASVEDQLTQWYDHFVSLAEPAIFAGKLVRHNDYLHRGAQWLSGRVLDSRPKGRGFEPHRRHCVVVLEQDTFILA